MSQPVFPSPEDAARAFAQTFSTPQGQKVLAHLRDITIERRSSVECSDAALRHLEGQRHLVKYIEDTLNRGKQP